MHPLMSTMKPCATERRFHVLDLILRLPLMVFALSCLYAHTESETSYTWKLDLDVGKVDESVSAVIYGQNLMC
jgi:hypothetical protein